MVTAVKARFVSVDSAFTAIQLEQVPKSSNEHSSGEATRTPFRLLNFNEFVRLYTLEMLDMVIHDRTVHKTQGRSHDYRALRTCPRTVCSSVRTPSRWEGSVRR